MTTGKWALILTVVIGAPSTFAQSSGDQALQEASRRVADTHFVLQYKMAEGEQLVYDVEHLVKVATEIQGMKQRTQSRSSSAKLWKVLKVDPAQGQFTFTHEVVYVDMWNEPEGGKPTRYDSRSGEPPPAEFEHVAASIGKPIAKVTAHQTGRIVKREDEVNQHDLGAGGLLLPLPEGPVELHAQWSVPSQISVRLTDGSFKTVKTRQLYELQRVEAGVATISTKTQILTPAIDARMRSQLMQKVTNGTIRFDLDAGHVLSRQLDWDEEVVGFSGQASNMSYQARLTESLRTEPQLAERPD